MLKLFERHNYLATHMHARTQSPTQISKHSLHLAALGSKESEKLLSVIEVRQNITLPEHLKASFSFLKGLKSLSTVKLRESLSASGSQILFYVLLN